MNAFINVVVQNLYHCSCCYRCSVSNGMGVNTSQTTDRPTKSFYSLFRITARNILKQNITYPIIDEYISHTVYPKKYAHGFVVLCFVVVLQSFIINSHEVFIHIHQDCFAGTGAIVRLPQCQWSKPGGYGEISQCITTTKHSKAKTVCIFLGIYSRNSQSKGCSVVYHGDELRTCNKGRDK